MLNKLTQAERRHLAKVKELPCGVCGSQQGSEAHHIRQHQQYVCIPLCPECHRGPMGIHGDKTLWRIHKLDELEVLNETIRRLLDGR